ncbi:hypothetical protein GW17_00061354 [Ensete ventricosum]|nr:hypothetical protein GW17_00061354 [Ensete ventricosum]
MRMGLEKVRLLSSTARSMRQIKRRTHLEIRSMSQITPRDVPTTGALDFPRFRPFVSPPPNTYYGGHAMVNLLRSNMLCNGKLK